MSPLLRVALTVINRKEEFVIAQERDARINHEITAPEVRLIGDAGEPMGVVIIKEALRIAEEKEIDLVEISPTATPPVCRLMDYGKYKYQQSKKKHKAKLQQKQVQIKEIKFRPNTDEADYQIKLRNLLRFLSEGNKVKTTLRFRGREIAHQEFGRMLLKRVEQDVADQAIIEQFPKMEGRQMIMVIASKKK